VSEMPENGLMCRVHFEKAGAGVVHPLGENPRPGYLIAQNCGGL
jgi:hypothetical protein